MLSKIHQWSSPKIALEQKSLLRLIILSLIMVFDCSITLSIALDQSLQ
jgi:hypothetical protein